MKRSVFATAAGLLVVLTAGISPGAAQVGATVADTGWWTRRPGAAALPPGGFEVAEAPDDDISIAALRVRTSNRLTRARLILTEAGGVRQADGALRVCVTASSWTAANPGAWAARPQADCAGGGIELARDATRTSWSANILPLLPAAAGTASLMIVPGVPPSGLPVDGFQVTFAGAAVDADEAPDDDDEPGGGSSAGGDTSGSSGGSSFGFGGGVESPGDFGFSGIPDGLGTDIPVDTTDSTTGEEVATGQPFTRAPVDTADGGGRQPWGRLPGLVVLAGIAGAVTASARRVARDRELLPTR